MKTYLRAKFIINSIDRYYHREKLKKSLAPLLFPRCHEFIDRRDDCLLDFPRLLVSSPSPVHRRAAGRIEATEDHGSFNRIYRNAIHEGE